MASKVPVFSNFNKTTVDFLSREFPSSHKVELTTKAEKGLTFISSGEHKTRKDGTEYVLGKLETKYKWEKYGLDFKGSVDTDNVVKSELSLDNLGLPGFKAVFKPQTGKTQEFSAGVEFQHVRGSFSTSALWKDGDTLLTAAAVGGHKGLSFGVESSYSARRAQPDKNPVGLESVKGLFNYKSPSLNVTVTAQLWKVEKSLLATVEHKPHDNTVMHTSLEYDTNQALGDVHLLFGGSHKLDENTTAMAKYDTEGKLTVHVGKQFTPQFKGSFTTEFNLHSLHGSEHKFAWGLNFKA